MVKVQKALLNLWNKCEGLDDTVNLEQPLTFNDRLRFRKPNTDSNLDPIGMVDLCNDGQILITR